MKKVLSFPEKQSIEQSEKAIYFDAEKIFDSGLKGLELKGNCLADFGLFDGDLLIVDSSAIVKHGDFAIIQKPNGIACFMVYIKDETVFLHGETIQTFNRSEVIFLGRVIKFQRDF